jgi:lipopolysaccharide transport system ATP-binding protein
VSDVLVQAEGVSKKFCRSLQRSLRYGVQDLWAELRGRRQAASTLRAEEFWSLKDASFELRRGESLGLLGRNGAGKTTLLQLLNGRLKLDEGRITLRGTTGLVTELGAGFNPVQSGRENIYNSAAVLGMPRERVEELYGDIVQFAELEAAMDAPVQTYSSGMRARLGYAVVAHLKPDVLMVDEVLAVGDIAFRRKCLQHMIRYLRGGGSLVLVSHDMYALQSICTRCLLLEDGRVLFDGSSVEGLNRYYSMMMALRAAPPGDHAPEATPAAAAGVPEGEAEAAAEAWMPQPDGPPAPTPAAPAQIIDIPDALEAPAGDPTPSHPVVIDRLLIRGPDEKPLQTGDPAVVELHYRALFAYEGVLWAFTISTGDQLVQITSGLAGFGDRLFPLKEGRGVLRGTIPRLPLVGGTYVLKGGIADRETRSGIAEIGFEERAPVVFSVRAPVDELNNVRAYLGNLVVIDVVWDE